MQRMHPILSPLGIGFTILIFLGLGISFILDGSAMFNPGKLTTQASDYQSLGGYTSHAEFENECRFCHAPFRTTQGDLCTRCHTDITKQLADQSGSHAKMKNISNCRSCHPDHRGRDFDATRAGFALFDHNLANFVLTWHQIDFNGVTLSCESCHNLENRFIVQQKTCMACHEEHDPEFMKDHQQSVGNDCLACHDGSGNLAKFDHATTQFVLDGRHAQIECVDCHADGNFVKLPTDCLSCHAEPEIHAGLYSLDCKACHTSEDWAALAWLNGGQFDHFEQTGFSLNKHVLNYLNQPMKCADCHTSPDGLEITFDLQFCVDCHTTEKPIFMGEHQSQFGVDCLTCHDGIDRMHNFDHDQFFTLDGGHVELACVNCHIEQVYSGTPTECAACHGEPEIHAGVFGTQCGNCHNTSAWQPAEMVVHTFPLNHGDQGMVSCETCHPTIYIEYTCYGCHEHQPNQTLNEHSDEGIAGSRLENCVACHPTGLKDEAETIDE